MDSRELRGWMARNGYTVRGLASALGVRPSTVQRWRMGERAIPTYLELALAGIEHAATQGETK